MKKLIFMFVLACGLMSAGTVSNAVYTVEGGVYYHHHGDCAVKEKSHDHERKIRLMSRQTAEDKLYLSCPKCARD